ncbi:MAG: TlpA family protein disulfide reductase [Saprospiraceae bacterium]
MKLSIYSLFCSLLFLFHTAHSQQITEFSASPEVLADFDSILVQTYSITTPPEAGKFIRSEENNKLYFPTYNIDFVSFLGVKDGVYTSMIQQWFEGKKVVAGRKNTNNERQYELKMNKFKDRNMRYQQKIAQTDTLNKEALFFVALELLHEVKNTPYASKFVQLIRTSYPSDITKHQFAYQLIKNQPLALQTSMHMTPQFAYFKNLSNLNTITLDSFPLISAESTMTAKKDKDITILDFWFTACPPCIADHNLIANDTSFYNQYNLISISIDSKESDWRAYLEKHQLPWNNLLEVKTDKVKLSSTLGLMQYPSYLVLDKDNRRIAIAYSFEELKLIINGIKVMETFN